MNGRPMPFSAAPLRTYILRRESIIPLFAVAGGVFCAMAFFHESEWEASLWALIAALWAAMSLYERINFMRLADGWNAVMNAVETNDKGGADE